MPFVQTRHQRRHEESNGGPTHGPPRSPRQAQRSPPGAKQKKTQGKVADKMATFPDVMMHHFKGGRAQTHEEMKQGIQKSAGVLRRKPVSRFNRDQPDPQERSNPGFEQLLLIGGQKRASPASWKTTNPFKTQPYSTA